MPVETSSLFASVIEDHLALKERNRTLEEEMPIDSYKIEDPFENHPLFKTEEQARIEETLDGEERIPDELLEQREAEVAVHGEEALWGRSRDFDWGD